MSEWEVTAPYSFVSVTEARYLAKAAEEVASKNQSGVRDKGTLPESDLERDERDHSCDPALIEHYKKVEVDRKFYSATCLS